MTPQAHTSEAGNQRARQDSGARYLQYVKVGWWDCGWVVKVMVGGVWVAAPRLGVCGAGHRQHACKVLEAGGTTAGRPSSCDPGRARCGRAVHAVHAHQGVPSTLDCVTGSLSGSKKTASPKSMAFTGLPTSSDSSRKFSEGGRQGEQGPRGWQLVLRTVQAGGPSHACKVRLCPLRWQRVCPCCRSSPHLA